jgi:hypothetical protein
MLKKLVLLGLVLAAFIVPTSSITQAQVTDIPIAGATTTDGVIGIATPEAA